MAVHYPYILYTHTYYIPYILYTHTYYIPYILYTIHIIYPYILYTIHIIYHTYYIPYILYTIHIIYHTYYIPYILYTIHIIYPYILYTIHIIYGTRLKNVLKTVRSVCVARRQRFPKNGVKRSGPFRSTVRFVPLHGPLHSVARSVPFRFFSTQGFLATEPDSINFAKKLAKPRPVALIPPAAIFAIYRPV